MPKKKRPVNKCNYGSASNYFWLKMHQERAGERDGLKISLIFSKCSRNPHLKFLRRSEASHLRMHQTNHCFLHPQNLVYEHSNEISHRVSAIAPRGEGNWIPSYAGSLRSQSHAKSLGARSGKMESEIDSSAKFLLSHLR
jgi:hypothetical protein